ncbi:Protein CBG26422 [Caenorhabditis briggsae]|uniref:Protein CBG26422 n=1 Tax=Caenorhabditis briggsae TaxID=6238 RepID=B6ILF5_CAEBR|nr:Protein CBG26422 [Caenorhabditis briggsae]CAS00735.1 Protein CBG26422 [Caenorhabditis briggsae]
MKRKLSCQIVFQLIIQL